MPLKIVLTDPHLRGGGQVRYLSNLCQQFVRNGHEVYIGCRPGSVLQQHAERAKATPLPVFHFVGGLRPRAWLHDLRAMAGILRDLEPDIVHVNGSQDHWTAALANRWAGRPACLVRTRHNTYRVGGSLPNRVLNRNWTDYQIVVCEFVRADLAGQPTFDAERMESIHNGVDAAQYQPDPEARRRMRQEFGFAEDHVVCGIAARLVAAKGHRYLFEAVGALVERLPQLRVLALGEGPLEGELRRMVGEVGLDERVVFAGFREDMPACVQAFDIGIQPSIDCDTSSFSLKEQMAAGKPVIASDFGGLPEILTNGKEGFIIPAGTAEPLADAIERLASDAAMRAEIGRLARERVLSEFTIERFAQKTLEAYGCAMQWRRKRRSSEC